MKRTVLTIVLGILMLPAMAQLIHENEAGLVYYMPYTSLALEVEYDEITTTTGPFYQYSERYLGTKDVITENATTFVLKSVRLRTKTTADTSREFKVPVSASIDNFLLNINDKGILCGYNVQTENKSTTTSPKAKVTPSKADAPVILPLFEEQMMTGSVTKQAEGAAKQIYRIREDRMDLLSGNLENAPADGKAMELVLKEMNKREQTLTALFTGTRTTKHHTQFISIAIEDVEAAVAFRFSKFFGLVDADDMSGDPVYFDMTTTKQEYMPYAEKEKPAKTSPTGIYYNLPGSASIKVYSSLLNEPVNAQKPVAQFGISVPVSADMLKGTHIVFNPQTGNIQSITK